MELTDKLRKFKNEILTAIAKEVLVVERMDDIDLVNWRKRQCEKNICAYFNAKDRMCMKCECYVDAKTVMKINNNPHKMMRHEITHCPEGMWNDKDIVNLYKYQDGEDLIN